MFESDVFCPLCFAAPAMEIRFRRDGRGSAKCMACLTEYELRQSDDGEGFTFSVFVPRDKILGSTGESLLRALLDRMLPDQGLTVDTRRQLRKLEAMGLVDVTRDAQGAYWRITQRGHDILQGEE
jgi:hypothetical protein